MLSSAIAYIQAAAAAPGTDPSLLLTAKKIEPTTLDWVGSIAALITLGLAGAVLLGMAGWMVYKALTQPQSLQTSWNPPQEAQFESYATVETSIHKRSWMFAFVGGAIMTVLALAVYFGVTPEKDKIGDTMDLSTFDKKTKAPAPGPTP